MEYFSDLFARKLYHSNCSSEILVLVVQKVKYLIQKVLNRVK